jgi:hypothetical protein
MGAFPTGTVLSTTNIDAEGDDPSLFREDALDLVGTVNAIVGSLGDPQGIVPLESNGSGGARVPAAFMPLNLTMTWTAKQTFSSVDITANGRVTFANSLGTKLDLWGGTFTVGLQGSTLYFRAPARFAFYFGGEHNDTAGNAGAGGVSGLQFLNTGAVFSVPLSATSFDVIRQGTAVARTATALLSQNTLTPTVVQESFSFGASTTGNMWQVGKARGTQTTPTATQAGDILARYSFSAHTGSGWAETAAWWVEMAATATPSTAPSLIRFAVAAPGSFSVGPTSLTIAPHGITAPSTADVVQTLVDVALPSSQITWNGNLGATAVLAMVGAKNRQISNITNAIDGVTYTLLLQQDASGGEAVGTWGSAYRFAGGIPPTLTSTANKMDLFQFKCIGGQLYETGRTMGL